MCHKNAKKRKLLPFIDELNIAEAWNEMFQNIRTDAMDEWESGLPGGIERKSGIRHTAKAKLDL